MLGTGQIMSTVSRPLDYMYFWRADQQLPGRNDIKEMAAEYGLTTKDWGGTDYISLGMDGEQYVEEEDGSFYYEYAPLIMEARFLPEEGWEALTGEAADIAPGTYMAVTNESESVSHSRNTDATLLTNPVTRQTIGTVFGGWLHCDMLAGDIDYYVLNTRDYQTVSQGLTPAWQGGIAWFNIDGEDSYDFASSLYYRLVDSFGPECELPSYYDRIDKMICNEKGEVYWGDTEDMTPVDYSRPDSTEFRTYWAYMPLFRILDQNDFLRTFCGIPDDVPVHRHRLQRGGHDYLLHPLPDHRPEQPLCIRQPEKAGRLPVLPVPGSEKPVLQCILRPRHHRYVRHVFPLLYADVGQRRTVHLR